MTYLNPTTLAAHRVADDSELETAAAAIKKDWYYLEAMYYACNSEYGVAATVTQVVRGYAVTFLDTDADEIIGVRIYPHTMQTQAIEYARYLTR